MTVSKCCGAEIEIRYDRLTGTNPHCIYCGQPCEVVEQPVSSQPDRLLTPEEIQNHLYKISSAPESFEFTPEDGTLIKASYVNIKSLLQSQLAKDQQLQLNRDAWMKEALKLRAEKEQAIAEAKKEGFALGRAVADPPNPFLEPLAVEEMNKRAKNFCYEIRKEGMRELAEWAEETCYKHQSKVVPTQYFRRWNCDICWQAKLKELGL